MRIGQVAEQVGVGVETVRFYEQKGLIRQPPKPLAGGYREYPPQSVHCIRFIRSAQQLGFSLVEIAELLELDASTAAQCVDVKRRAEIKRSEAELKISNLITIKNELDRLINACPGKGLACKCSILEAINSGELDLTLIKEGEYNGRQDPKN